MPLFNESQYVASAIESLITQTYTNWILLAQDNFSSDSTPEILRQYSLSDSRITFRENSQFCSASSNWKTLYEYASQNFDYEYICFLAGDDYWSNREFLEESISEFILNPRQSASIPTFLVKYQSENREVQHSTCITGIDSKIRIINYCKYWANANVLYGVFRADYFEEKMKQSLTRFTEYKGSDWWWGLGIAVDQEVFANKKMLYVKRVSPVTPNRNEMKMAISNLKERLLFIFDHLINEHHRLVSLSPAEKLTVISFTLKIWWIQTVRAVIHLASTILNSKKLGNSCIMK
jgi:glycosyltransferase involved in cell wall biosynthesis